MNKASMRSNNILGKSQKISNNYPKQSRHLSQTPVLTLDYADPHLNQQELEDYHDSLVSMMDHSLPTSLDHNGISSSHPRPEARRVLDSALLEFDLDTELKNIKYEANWTAGNQSAKTLVKSDNMRVVLIAMHQGHEMKKHKANGPVSLQVLEGNVECTIWESSVTIKAGQFIALHKKVPHKLVAKEQSILLLTMMNMDDEQEEGPEENEIEKKEIDEIEIDKNEEEIVENSENINFPDFPTYPPEDDAYIAPEEIPAPQ